jgi:hypothetical protein
MAQRRVVVPVIRLAKHFRLAQEWAVCRHVAPPTQVVTAAGAGGKPVMNFFG